MNNQQVAHIWANQSRETARGSNFYFNGPTIYSYGPHFPIARIVENKGRRAVLFTTRGHSVSTSRHISYAQRALYGLDIPVFRVSDPTNARHDGTREEYKRRIKTAIESASKARRYSEMHVNDALALVKQANDYAEFFGLSWRLKEPDISPEKLADIRAKSRKEAARREKIRKAREAAALEAARESREAWRRGENSRYYGIGPTMLRLSGDTVETSRGASVPADDARRACLFVAAKRSSGEAWRRNGERFPVGAFQLDSVDASGTVRAGCHVIEWPEVLRIAGELGVSIS